MKIIIRDLTFEAILGLLKRERENTQTIVLNIDIEYIYSKENFLDYSIIIDLIENFFKEQQFYLIEDAILKTTNLLKESFDSIKKIKIEILKPNIIKNATVGIKYEEIF